MKSTQVRPSDGQLYLRRCRTSLLRMDRSPSTRQLNIERWISKSGETYHISYIPDTQLISLHLLLQTFSSVFQIYFLPFPDLLDPVSISPFFPALLLVKSMVGDIQNSKGLGYS
jgi:hypothetical protein